MPRRFEHAFLYNGAGDCLWVSICGLISGSQTIPRVYICMYVCVRTKTTREKLKETVIVVAIVNETEIYDHSS